MCSVRNNTSEFEKKEEKKRVLFDGEPYLCPTRMLTFAVLVVATHIKCCKMVQWINYTGAKKNRKHILWPNYCTCIKVKFIHRLDK